MNTEDTRDWLGADSEVTCEHCEEDTYRRVPDLDEDMDELEQFSCPVCGDGKYLNPDEVAA
jgi:NAD-dependent SIR2 family protein deacetylase